VFHSGAIQGGGPRLGRLTYSAATEGDAEESSPHDGDGEGQGTEGAHGLALVKGVFEAAVMMLRSYRWPSTNF
jgi:hypothetical protein